MSTGMANGDTRFAAFFCATRIRAWVTSTTITLDRYGQPLTGTDADRLARHQARTYLTNHD